MRANGKGRKDLLIELYLELLARGPGFGVPIEFWDPTTEAIVIFENLKGLSMNNKEKIYPKRATCPNLGHRVCIKCGKCGRKFTKKGELKK